MNLGLVAIAAPLLLVVLGFISSGRACEEL